MLTITANTANAQTVKEKIEAKRIALEKKLNEKISGSVASAALDPNVSQSEMAAKWEDKEFTKFTDVGGENGTVKLNVFDYTWDRDGQESVETYERNMDEGSL